jgi:RNA polymerase sigma-70 factor (ECF subfamily)
MSNPGPRPVGTRHCTREVREHIDPSPRKDAFGWEFRAFFEAHRPLVMTRLRRLGVPDADQSDVCQEIFVILHRRMPGYDGSIPLRAWVQSICDRVAATYLRLARRRRKRASATPVLGVLRCVPASQDREVDTRRACERAETLLKSLDDEKRRVFVLYELEGLHMYEVADELGCPLQTGYSRLRAARKIIRAQLLRSSLDGIKSS